MDVIKSTDILYVTRIQKERMTSLDDYERLKGCYVLDAQKLSMAPNTLRVMHPLPRVDEIAAEIDSDHRAIYFDQADNGVYVRMALLWLVMGRSVCCR